LHDRLRDCLESRELLDNLSHLALIEAIALKRKSCAHVRFERVVTALRHGYMIAYSPLVTPQIPLVPGSLR
jgi:hypothetical protein